VSFISSRPMVFRTAACVALLASLTLANGQDIHDGQPDGWRFTAKSGAGIAGGVGAYLAVGLAAYGLGGIYWGGPPEYYFWTSALALAIPAGTAGGVGLVGRHYGERGRYWAAYLGGFAGVVAGLGIVAAGVKVVQPVPRVGKSLAIPLYVAGAVSPAVGSTIGYNLSRSPGSDFWSRHLDPPSLALTVNTANPTRPAAEVRLVTLHF